jgi:hypothetical protein
MWQKLVCAVFALLVTIGLVTAGEFQATITKVDGNKITYQKYLKAKKGEKAEKDGDAVTITVAKDAKVLKGTFNKDTKKVEAGDAIEDGLKGEVFTKVSEEKGARALITTDDDKKVVTQILVLPGKKKN